MGMTDEAQWTLNNYKGGGASILHARRVLLLDKVSRLRKAGANLYRRAAIAAFEGRTKDFERLGRGAAICRKTTAPKGRTLAGAVVTNERGRTTWHGLTFRVAARTTPTSRKTMPSPCENCKFHPDEWDISVFMLNKGTCKAGHSIHTTDATPPDMYFDETGKEINSCTDKKD
ncbi:MAG: hypothetical protein JEY79_01210 [Pseudodesulfovibrio sp.]|nr:hypothetical protein [Pseudodesulfovibrio sp.]